MASQLRYVGVIQHVFHVLELLLIRFYIMKHPQKLIELDLLVFTYVKLEVDFY